MPASKPNTVTRRRILRILGAEATVSTLGGQVLTETATAHDLEVVFPSCQAVLIVVNDRSEFGALTETIRVFDSDAREVQLVRVELTPENTRSMRDRFGDRPVFKYTVSGDNSVVAVQTGDGQLFENPNDCPRPKPPTGTGAFALEQGDQCIPLSPLSFQNMTIEEFFGDQPNPQQSNTPTNLERERTSLLFLYRGPSNLTPEWNPNALGFIIIHGASGGPGGAASFGINGLPNQGSSIVFDEGNRPAEGDYFACGGPGGCGYHWAWDGGSDGTVFYPLGNEFAVRISPNFNEEASFDMPSGGGVERWQVLSGDGRNPDRTDLALDQPVILRSGSC